MRPIWIKSALLLVVVWVIAGGAMWWSKANKPTPESVVAYVEKLEMDGKSSDQRAKEMEKIAKQLNTLSFDQRRQVRLTRRLDGFFRKLNPDEQNRFLDLTAPEHFKQLMEALNKMKPVDRKRFVTRALKDLQEQEGELPEGAKRFDEDQHAQKIVEQGLKSFYTEANAETKMDLAPLIEQFQHNLQGLR